MMMLKLITAYLISVLATQYIPSGYIPRMFEQPNRQSISIPRPIRQVHSAGSLQQYGTSPMKHRMTRAVKSHNDMQEISSVSNAVSESMPKEEAFSSSIDLTKQPQPKSLVLMTEVFKRQQVQSYIKGGLLTKIILDWVLQSVVVETFVELPRNTQKFSRLMAYFTKTGRRKLNSGIKRIWQLFGSNNQQGRQRFVANVESAKLSQPIDFDTSELQDLSSQNQKFYLNWVIKSAIITQIFTLPALMGQIDINGQLLQLFKACQALDPDIDHVKLVKEIMSSFTLRIVSFLKQHEDLIWMKMLSFKTLAINYLILHDFYVHNFVATTYFDVDAFNLHLVHIPAQRIMVDVTFARWIVQHAEALYHDAAKLMLKVEKRLLAPKLESNGKFSRLFDEAEKTTAVVSSIDVAGHDVTHAVYTPDLFIQIVNGINAGIRIAMNFIPASDGYITAFVAGATITLTSIGVLENPHIAHDPNLAVVFSVKGIELVNVVKDALSEIE